MILNGCSSQRAEKSSEVLTGKFNIFQVCFKPENVVHVVVILSACPLDYCQASTCCTLSDGDVSFMH